MQIRTCIFEPEDIFHCIYDIVTSTDIEHHQIHGSEFQYSILKKGDYPWNFLLRLLVVTEDVLRRSFEMCSQPMMLNTLPVLFLRLLYQFLDQGSSSDCEHSCG